MIDALLAFLKPLLSAIGDLLARALTTVEGWLLIILFVLVIAGLISTIYVIRNEPVLVTADDPYLSPKFPSEGLEKLLPQQRDNKIVVLFQRIIWDLDHWSLGENPSNCEPSGERTPCDEVHAYGSWTVIVPSSGTKLMGSSAASTGKIGDVVALTPHTINADDVIDGIQNWSVTSFNLPAGRVESIVIRRDFFGGFQPQAASLRKSWEPPINKCQGNFVGIVIRNLTARAELIFHAPQQMLMRRGVFRLWARRASANSVVDITDAANRYGNVKVEDDNIYWSVGTELLRDADKDNTSYLISWTWAQPITKGPICGSSAGLK